MEGLHGRIRLSYKAFRGYRMGLTGRLEGGPVHYVRYKPDILDIIFEYSLKIPQIYSNMLKYT
jgi:hypothetical protein